MDNESIIRVAQFDPKVTTYWVAGGILGLLITVVGIPLIPVYALVGMPLAKRYLASMECVLTERTLKFKKGIFTKIEKTVPLEKITDLGMVQGPLMRHYGIFTLTMETAGQSGTGALLSLTGIEDASEFRELVLTQRDLLANKETSATTSRASTASSDHAVLNSIHETLLRIESTLRKD